jgi:hypothetical protein
MEAWCDYVTEDEFRGKLTGPSAQRSADEVEEALEQFRSCASFRVQEFAVLADGRRLALHDDLSGECGFSSRTSAYAAGSGPIDPWASLTLEDLEASVRTTVLLDDDETNDEHPWEWLAQRLRDHGVEATPEELKQVPYHVVFSQRLRDRVAAHA